MEKEYILFIDSGIGGLSTLSKSMSRLPANYIYYADNAHAPYGNHSRSELLEFLCEIINKLSKKYKFRIVVLACNTATTCCVRILRKIFKNLTIIGTEPALKLAKNQGFNKILAITTPATATQNKYLLLKRSQKTHITTHRATTLASVIEDYFAKQSFLSYIKLLKCLCFISQKALNFDCIVLGCTHYVLINNILNKFTQKPLIDGNDGVCKQIEQFHKKLVAYKENSPSVVFKFSKSTNFAEENYKKILSQILANL